jgi:membrane associated rhomboid family serine protease
MPATWALIGANALTFLLLASGAGAEIARLLAFLTPAWPVRFWTLLTWPLVGGGDPLSVLFSAGWFYTFAGSLERSWGTRPFVTFLVATAALAAFTLWLGGRLLGFGGGLAGLWVAVGPVMVVWAVLNRRETVNLLFLPLPAPIIGVIGVVMTWYFAGAQLAGLFALSGCAAAYWYAKHGRTVYDAYASGSSGGGLLGNLFAGRGRTTRTTTSASGTTLRFKEFDREPVGPRRPFSLSRWLRDRKQRRELEALWKRSNLPSDPDDKNAPR